MYIKCPLCKGTRKIITLGCISMPCPNCNGKGIVEKKEDIKEAVKSELKEALSKPVPKKRGRPKKVKK